MGIIEDLFRVQGEDSLLDQTEGDGLLRGCIKGIETGITEDRGLVEDLEEVLEMIKADLDQVEIEVTGTVIEVTEVDLMMIGVMTGNIVLMIEDGILQAGETTETEIRQDTDLLCEEDLDLLCMERILPWEQ